MRAAATAAPRSQRLRGRRLLRREPGPRRRRRLLHLRAHVARRAELGLHLGAISLELIVLLPDGAERLRECLLLRAPLQPSE